jgi:hypothetical protein
MALILHIAIALASIAWTAVAFFVPTKRRIELSYALVALTLATGTYLVWSLHTPLLQACMSGLFYLAVVFSGILAAQYRLDRIIK